MPDLSGRSIRPGLDLRIFKRHIILRHCSNEYLIAASVVAGVQPYPASGTTAISVEAK